MDCDICAREYNQKRTPLCAGCVQSILYGARVQQVTALLDREKSHTQAEAITRPGNDGILAALPDETDFDAISTGIRRHSHEQTGAELERTKQRISQILDFADEVNDQMADYKKKIEVRKAGMKHRRQELETARDELDKQRPRTIEPVISATKKASQRLERTRQKIVEARTLLCREAALTSGLQRLRDDGRSEYRLGSIPIPDLRALNKKTLPTQKTQTISGRVVAERHNLVSEGTENVARLLNLCSHYLGVRLPAEIILPHENFPRAVIMSERSSYKQKKVPFPGLSAGQSSSPAASRVIDREQPRPRPLWLDRPLGELSKEDPKAYGLYIEGVTLLAWNLAWLCKTQGIELVDFDGACNMGRNLWQLLIAATSGRKRPQFNRKDTMTSNNTSTEQELRLGIFSHTSAAHNLASWEGTELMRDWKLSSPARLVDKLRTALLNEISGAEWDLLEEDELFDKDSKDDQPVIVGGSRRPDIAMSVMSVKPSDGDDEDGSASDAKRREKGSSGWTKVRGRGDGRGPHG